MTLDEALDRLLYDYRVLGAFLSDGPGTLGVSEDDRLALDTIDREQLVLAHRKVRRELMTRKNRGCGGLPTLFANTLAGADLDVVARDFAASEELREHASTPFAVGTMLEEAFYRFAERTELGEPEVREHEFLAAVCRALVMAPEPRFTVPAEVQRVGNGWMARAQRGAPWVFAATERGFVRGRAR